MVIDFLFENNTLAFYYWYLNLQTHILQNLFKGKVSDESFMIQSSYRSYMNSVT